ncbi:MAG: hypothetical protein J7M14_04505, partial [Planctomycetes bacterium]|nr:hypothetical protein [Planctomycetota bacterium]
VLCAVFVLAAAGLLAAVMRRRWVFAAVLGAGVVIALSMRRNAPVGAMFIVTMSLGCLALPRPGRSRVAAAFMENAWVRWNGTLILAGVVVIVACWGAWGVATNRIYYPGRFMRFGLGISRTTLPIGAAEWINDNLPEGERIWCDYAGSSRLYCFTRPRRALPILTNTWAYPPQVMAQTRYSGGAPEGSAGSKGRLRGFFRQYGVNTVVLRFDWSRSLLRTLAASDEWACADVEGMYVVFVRTDGPLERLAEKAAIHPDDIDAAEAVERLKRSDPVDAWGLIMGGEVYGELGWHALSRDVLLAAIDEGADDPHVWFILGFAYDRLASEGRRLGKMDYTEDIKAAERCYGHVSPGDGDYERTTNRLKSLRRAPRGR